jgi:ribosomal protein S17E
MSELTALITRRGQLKSSLTRLATYIRDNGNSDVDIDQLKIRAEKGREMWDDFQHVQSQIEELNGVDDNTERYRNEFEELYYINLAKCEKLLREAASRAASTLSNGVAGNVTPTISDYAASRDNSVQSVQSTVKLAALQIPEFSGRYTEWASFYDIFTALIHKNESLDDVQKFFYLRSALTGDAENVIKCLQTTSNNYKIAWDSLIARYDNKRVLVQVHTQSIFDLEPIKKESSSQLRNLVDSLTGHLKALKSLGEKPDQWGSLLLHLVISKLDAKTMREWEIASSKMEVYSTAELITFMQSRFRVLEAIESSKQISLFQENNRKLAPTAKKVQTRSNAFAVTGEI